MNQTKIAAITGAASGIGFAMSRRLIGEGWTVFGIDVGRERGDAARAKLGDNFQPVECDVTDVGHISRAFTRSPRSAANWTR